MRSLLVVLAALAGTECAHDLPPPTPIHRKTLGFCPALSHAVFPSSPYGFTPQDAAMDLLQVVRTFLEDVLGEALSEDGAGKEYKIHDDSYTDRNTGVTHVYVRQLVNGLEIADSNVNLVIKDGVVLSYEKSFCPSPAPTPFISTAPLTRNFLQEHDALTSALCCSLCPCDPHFQSPIPLTFTYQIYAVHCQDAPLPRPKQYDPADFRPSLLHFIATVFPEVSLHIFDNFKQHVDSLRVTGMHRFADHSNSKEGIVFEVDNVPDTVGPVKVLMAYAQVPSSAEEGKTELELVWRYGVEMLGTWYEATVSASSPNTHISVVEWASDSPISASVKHLIPALVHFYIEVEQMGANSQFYDKFNARRSISYILKAAWNNPTHRKAWNEEAKNVDKFARFVNLMINEVTYLMDESLTKMTQICNIQVEMDDKEIWNSKSVEYRRELEGTLRSLELHASSYITLGRLTVELLKLLTTETKAPFMMPKIVDHLAAMLNYNLHALVGPKHQEFKVRDPEKLKFNPKALLGDIIQVFLNLCDQGEFVRAVAMDGRSYSKELFERAMRIAITRRIKTEIQIEKLRLFIVKVEETKVAMEAEGDLEEIPDKHLSMFCILWGMRNTHCLTFRSV